MSPTDFKLPIPYQNVPRAGILRPDVDGILHFKTNSSIQLSCTTNKFMLKKLKGVKEITVICLNKTLFSYKGEAYSYYDFRCETIPLSKLVMTSHKCQNNSSVAAVGFQVKYKFLILYNICFDMVNKIPLYSWFYTTSPHYSRALSYPERPTFIKSKQYYNDIDMHAMYKKQVRTEYKSSLLLYNDLYSSTILYI